MEMEYVKLFKDQGEILLQYGDEELGRLFRAMWAYNFAGTEPAFNGPEKYVWPIIRKHLDGCKTKATVNAQNASAPDTKPKTARKSGSESKRVRSEPKRSGSESERTGSEQVANPSERVANTEREPSDGDQTPSEPTATKSQEAYITYNNITSNKNQESEEQETVISSQQHESRARADDQQSNKPPTSLQQAQEQTPLDEDDQDDSFGALTDQLIQAGKEAGIISTKQDLDQFLQVINQYPCGWTLAAIKQCARHNPQNKFAYLDSVLRGYKKAGHIDTIEEPGKTHTKTVTEQAFEQRSNTENGMNDVPAWIQELDQVQVSPPWPAGGNGGE